MHDALIRLNKTTMAKMKRDARAVFTEARHTHALEAIARGLGAQSFSQLRDHARDYGGVLWDRSDAEAVLFLAERGVSVQSGGLALVVSPHEVDHELVVRPEARPDSGEAI
ncbi:MAG: hypothetical protein C0458_17480 [Methylobacterium sp.]|nr:hypothetical protein [Methylobacterium sp.]